MSAFTVREPRAEYGGAQGLPPERVLSELWATQRIPEAALVTTSGQPVTVLHPGIAGRGAGPDFRWARIEIAAGVTGLGDVELHVRATDFRGHGHHQDARYDNVMLHVVFEDDIGADTLLANGQRVPVIELAAATRVWSEDLTDWLLRPQAWQEPCVHALERMGPERLLEALDDFGARRFEERKAELAAAIGRDGAGAALFSALVPAALGRGALPECLSGTAVWEGLCAVLASELGAEAALLGMAGFLQEGIADRHPHARALAETWARLGQRARAGADTPAPARPANHPARRLAGLARLLERHRSLLAGRTDAFRRDARSLVEAWTVPSDGYWDTHVCPGRTAMRSPGALIGRGRAIELLVNAVLPWAAARAALAGDVLLERRVERVYQTLPAPGRYGRLAFLERNLWGNEMRMPLSALRQQGLLALFKTECTQGGCGTCLFS